MATALRADTRARTQALAEQLGAEVVPHAGAVGGGGAPGQALAGWAVALPSSLAAPLRARGVVGRVLDGRLLLDLRTVPPADDADVAEAVRAVLAGGAVAG